MTWAEFILAAVTAQRAGELALSSFNTRRLKARGALEVAPRHYPLVVAVHACWLLALWLFGHDRPIKIAALIFYLVLQGLRLWVMRTLGPRWTTRIIVLPGERLISAGPYRWLAHPNYVVVVGEIAVLPLALGLPWLAIIFTILNAAVLFIRIRAENRALGASGEMPARAAR